MKEQQTKSIPECLHDVEEHIIQMNGLLKALQRIESDESAQNCLVQSCDERLKRLENDFYKLWTSFVPQKKY